MKRSPTTGSDKRRYWRGAWAPWLLALLAAFGCARSPRTAEIARRQAGLRADSLNWTVKTLAESERRSTSQLARTWAGLVAGEQAHAQDLRDTLRAVGPAREAEQRAWQERGPVYERRALEILLGKPEELDRTLILMFY